MSGTVLYEEEYVCHCRGWNTGDGAWVPTVLFERRADMSKPLVKAVRYRFNDARYSTEREALVAAEKLAIQKARAGDVDFDR